MTGSITRNRAVAALLAGATAAMLTAGCGAGQISQTAEVVPAVPGANSTTSPGADNPILLRNVLLTYPGPDGYRQGATAPLELWIFNTGPRPVTLVRVTTNGASEITMTGGVTPTGSASASPAGGVSAGPSSGVSPTPTPDEATQSPGASSTPSPSPSRLSPSGPASSPSGTGTASPGGSTGAPSTGAAPAGRPVRVTIPPGGYAVLSARTGATLQLVGLARVVRPGEALPGVRFEFDNGTVITLDVPVGLPESPGPRSPMVFEENSPGGAPGIE